MSAATASTSQPDALSTTTSQHERHVSKLSTGPKSSSSGSLRSHQEYMETLVIPSPELVKQITIAQEKKEEEGLIKRLSMESLHTSEERREKAAAVIQRNYRGHRARRMLNGLSLDPSSRWIEAIKEARYRHIIEPKARPVLEGGTDNGTLEHQRSSSFAKQNWKKVGLITRRAGGDEDPDSESEEDEHIPPEEREAYQRRHLEEKLRRHKAAKMMDLQYFLEMVDLKHRYGANLRTYHEQWKKSNTNENFFYWLDYGEGKYIDCLGCPREKLDREQIRYLSREERLNYLVMVDQEGRLCWVKNGARIDTTEKYKDSIHGIVPENDPTPAYTPLVITDTTLQDTSEGTYSEASSLGSEGEEDHTPKYETVDPDQNMKRVKHVSAATILDKLLRGTVKENTWIFVADTNFRLYVGMKQSGSFQHSSFLHGSRISAAGSITIKNGRIMKLSPLSGHYRPPGTRSSCAYFQSRCLTSLQLQTSGPLSAPSRMPA